MRDVEKNKYLAHWENTLKVYTHILTIFGLNALIWHKIFSKSENRLWSEERVNLRDVVAKCMLSPWCPEASSPHLHPKPVHLNKHNGLLAN